MSDSDHDIDDDGGGLEVFFEEVKIQVKDFHKAIHSLSKETDKKKQKKKSDNADSAKNSAQDAIDIFKKELQSADSSQRKQYEKEFKKQQEKYNDCVERLKELRSSKPEPAQEDTGKKSNAKKKDDLLGKEDTKKKLGANDEDDIELDETPKKKKKDKGGQKQKHHDDVQQVIDIQNATTDIIEGMLGTSDEIIEIGSAAQEKLKQQTEKMVQIQKELDDLGSDLKRARKELNAFMRGLACDHCMGKVIIAAIILLALGVIAIIVLRSVKPDIFSPQAAPTPAPTPAPTTPAPIFA